MREVTLSLLLQVASRFGVVFWLCLLISVWYVQRKLLFELLQVQLFQDLIVRFRCHRDDCLGPSCIERLNVSSTFRRSERSRIGLSVSLTLK